MTGEPLDTVKVGPGVEGWVSFERWREWLEAYSSDENPACWGRLG